jgi:hypothetical protein
MDFKQNKLTKSEWESIEIPVSQHEQQIIKMITAGFTDVNTSFNNNCSILGFMKILPNNDDDLSKMHYFIYDLYLKKNIVSQLNKHFKDNNYNHPKEQKTSLRKIDKMRIEKNTLSSMKNSPKGDTIFEFQMLDLSCKMIRYIQNNNTRFMLSYYSLVHLMNCDILNINIYLIEYIKHLLEHFKYRVDMLKLVSSSSNYIEKNSLLLQYDNIKLYDHQKELFTIFKKDKLDTTKSKKYIKDTLFQVSQQKKSKLVLYIAPTATGKTLSPIALSEGYKIIYVCAARHVGLALAKSAISTGKKIAFGFGCSCAEDIRLHYFAAVDYTKDWKSGKIRKVDNSNGEKVEIMICDIQSYEYAMYYMLQFNQNPENIILFWDEPTITLDYETHENHTHIKNTWSKNIIPNVVLSSATLPKEDEIGEVIVDFRSKFMDFDNFENSDIKIHSIISHDCKKTIPIINSSGMACLPHHMCTTYHEFVKSIDYCKNNMTIFRYFDLNEIDIFIKHLHTKELISDKKYISSNYFENVSGVTMKSVKMYYIDLCYQITEDIFTIIKDIKNLSPCYIENNISTVNPSQRGTMITTNDAYTLTDGPTIYMTNNPGNIGKYCLKNLDIPTSIIDSIVTNIEYNNTILAKINKLEQELEAIVENEINVSGTDGKTKVNDRKLANDDRMGPEVKKLRRDIDTLLQMIKNINVEDRWVPNTKKHCEKWISQDIYDIVMNSENIPYSSKINETDVQRILEIPNVPNLWRILLSVGIGVFDNSLNQQYMELMKEFADSQKLYLIIANDDYIYGTNYQFCHGFIGKDLVSISQEKTIQALGRVGRNNLQKNYSVRFRNDELIKNIFLPQNNKPEVINMNKLFNSEED